jgi:hypothetical protein
MLIGRLISGNSRDASASSLAGHAGLQFHVLTRHSLANAFFRTRPISVLTMYKSDKMARVNSIVTNMRFNEECIHCLNSGQSGSISYFRSSERIRQALLASWGRGPRAEGRGPRAARSALTGAERASDKLDESCMLVTEKVFGFLTAAVAVQLFLDGLASEGIIGAIPH